MVVSLRATSALGRIFGWSSLFWKQENACTYCGVKVYFWWDFDQSENEFASYLSSLLVNNVKKIMALKDYRSIFQMVNNCINSHFDSFKKSREYYVLLFQTRRICLLPYFVNVLKLPNIFVKHSSSWSELQPYNSILSLSDCTNQATHVW